MIKYAKLDGYNNRGEVQMFSHVYEFVEINKNEPIIILIHAYSAPNIIFKGYLYERTKTFKSVPLLDSERKVIEECVGAVTQCPFNEFINITGFAGIYKGYKEE